MLAFVVLVPYVAADPEMLSRSVDALALTNMCQAVAVAGAAAPELAVAPAVRAPTPTPAELASAIGPQGHASDGWRGAAPWHY